MHAITVMMVDGMSGFVLGPLLGGTALATCARSGCSFVRHERRSASPMLDLSLFSSGTVRGATIAQIDTSIAMASVVLGLILHFSTPTAGTPCAPVCAVAMVVGVIAIGGALTLTDSRAVEEPV